MDEKPTTEMKTRPGELTKGGDLEIIENRQYYNGWFEEYNMAVSERCDALPAERYELVKNLEVLTDWGVEFHYLRINSEGNPVESKYPINPKAHAKRPYFPGFYLPQFEDQSAHSLEFLAARSVHRRRER